MHRRSVLLAAGSLGAGGLAGCIRDERRATGSAEPTSSPSPSPSPSPTPAPDVETSDIQTTDASCASGDGDGPSLTGDVDAHRLTVTGTLTTGNPCYRATLTDVDLDGETLTVTVGAVPEDGVCIQCVGAIQYDATVTLTAGLDATVVVRHDTGDGPTEVARESVPL